MPSIRNYYNDVSVDDIPKDVEKEISTFEGILNFMDANWNSLKKSRLLLEEIVARIDGSADSNCGVNERASVPPSAALSTRMSDANEEVAEEAYRIETLVRHLNRLF